MVSISEALSLALDHHGAGRLEVAAQLYDQILNAVPDHSRALYLAATVMCQRGEFERALAPLTRAVTHEPTLSVAHLGLAKAFVRVERHEEAGCAARRALALTPADAETWDLLATIKRPSCADAAITALTRARHLVPNDTSSGDKLALLLHERARRHLDDQCPARALVDLEAAAGLTAFDPELAFARATALLEVGRTTEAVTLHRRLLAYAPGEARVWRGLGDTLMRSERLATAATALTWAHAADPEDPEPCELLTALFDRRDDAVALHWSTVTLEIKLRAREKTGHALALFADVGPPPSDRRRDVVSFSLWGALEAYCAGALVNAREVPQLLPGWVCRFYHDDTVPPHILTELAGLGAELVVMPPGSARRQGMFWRFLPSDDPGVHRFLVRDSDSRLTRREIAAVKAWIASSAPFHVIRDHPMHMEPVMGGMWGGTAGLLPPIADAINRFTERHSSRLNDQHFLAEWLWPRIVNRALVHDGVHPGFGAPLPGGALAAGECHVGGKLLDLIRLPPMRAPARSEDVAEVPGRHGILAHPVNDPHVGRSLATLGEWLALETQVIAWVLRPGDIAIDADAGIGATTLAMARAVARAAENPARCAGGRVIARELRAGLFACLERTVAANGLSNVVISDAQDRVGVAELTGDRVRLLRATLSAAGDPLFDELGGMIARDRPFISLRIDDDGAVRSAVTHLLALGYRAWWHLAPAFNPNNRSGVTRNPFPGLIAVNLFAAPAGTLSPEPSWPVIDHADADWREASWRLRCDGIGPGSDSRADQSAGAW